MTPQLFVGASLGAGLSKILDEKQRQLILGLYMG